MKDDLGKACDEAHRRPQQNQEILGLVVTAALPGRDLTVAQAVEAHMLKMTWQCPEEAEGGKGVDLAEWQAQLATFPASLQQRR